MKLIHNIAWIVACLCALSPLQAAVPQGATGEGLLEMDDNTVANAAWYEVRLAGVSMPQFESAGELTIEKAVEISWFQGFEERNYWYQFQTTSSLPPEWSDLGKPFPGGEPSRSLFLPASESQAYYRLLLVGTNATPTLSTFVQSLVKSTGEVLLNGGEFSPDALAPFHFDWGDGTVSDGWFPQAHSYADKGRAYLVNTTVHYKNGSSATVSTLVDFQLPKTLGIFVQSVNRSSGQVTINGGESSSQALAPFLFLWGDGTCTEGWFPQTHTYSSTAKNHIVKVIVTYRDGSCSIADAIIKFN